MSFFLAFPNPQGIINFVSMDSRITLNTTETFLEILQTAFQAKQKVNLLIDDCGVTRKEGLITVIHGTSPIFIELSDGCKIDLATIIAVNGIFRPEYGEC